MGQEDTQTHRFRCRNCKEEIAIRMLVDYVNISTDVVCDLNGEITDAPPDSPIVNVDANFVVSEGGNEFDFNVSRLQQIHAMAEAAQKAGRLVTMPAGRSDADTPRPFRRPDYSGEWESIKKAWSLAQPLSEERVRQASAKLYPKEPLQDLPDWLWRLALFLCDPAYEQAFRNAVSLLVSLKDEQQFKDWKSWFTPALRKARAQRYYDSMKEFFDLYDEFAQVYFYVSKEVEIPAGHKATSAAFDRVKMFYGNMFERFASSADFLAYIGNMKNGRPYDQFAALTNDEYLKLDKAGRFKAFESVPELAALCSEADNQLRNASHHNGMSFDEESQIITYRSGKGGLGAEQQIEYIRYLERSVRIFLQMMTLFRMELILARQFGVPAPV
jgi:hypothetical protein